MVTSALNGTQEKDKQKLPVCPCWDGGETRPTGAPILQVAASVITTVISLRLLDHPLGLEPWRQWRPARVPNVIPPGMSCAE